MLSVEDAAWISTGVGGGGSGLCGRNRERQQKDSHYEESHTANGQSHLEVVSKQALYYSLLYLFNLAFFSPPACWRTSVGVSESRCSPPIGGGRCCFDLSGEL